MTSFVNPDGLRRLCRAGSRARKRLGRYQTIPLFSLICPAVRPIFQRAPICPRHPGAPREVIRRPAAYQLHGESHPSRGSHATAPIACDGCQHARTLGWTGVSLSPLPVMAVPGAARYWQPAVSRSLLGANEKTGFLFGGFTLCPSANRRAAAAWALAFAKAAGMCLMNGYAVFKVPGGHQIEPLTLFAVE